MMIVITLFSYFFLCARLIFVSFLLCSDVCSAILHFYPRSCMIEVEGGKKIVKMCGVSRLTEKRRKEEEFHLGRFRERCDGLEMEISWCGFCRKAGAVVDILLSEN